MYDSVIIGFLSIISLVSFIGGCVCCRKKVPKNELLGLEGLVKITNPDENITSASSLVSVDPTASNKITQLDLELRRASNAPHRSLPDIPISDQIGDTNSELYATVGDKVLEKPQGRSPTTVTKKQPSVSQHSSLSQADDISSPYARVKSPPHNYDKVRHTEHPYAQLNQTGNTNLTQLVISEGTSSSSSNPIQNSPTSVGAHNSSESIIGSNEDLHEIPAASAIAGRIAASQELPYMTPPIVQPSQINFSGDSQDSSKGYTSISVREPLANIIAQTNKNNQQLRRREISDSHYATVSDDSDEMYAAIDDPNNPGDLYTSGSETYAQIQPPQPTAIVVSVEINPAPRISQEIQTLTSRRLSATNAAVIQNTTETPVVSETLNAHMHSRQASSSSCTSSVGNLGSPKPEKRQANSPLPPPPTPKGTIQSQHSSTSTSSIPSGRNSVASVIEVTGRSLSKENLNVDSKSQKKVNSDDVGTKKKQSPSKDLEGMYAKVMKKNKLSNLPSQNSSPILTRKNDKSDENCSSNADILNDTNAVILNKITNTSGKNNILKITDNNYETIDKRRTRSSSFDNKDPGYETIPGDKGNNNMNKSFGEFNKIKSNIPNNSGPVGALAQGIQRVSQNTIAIFNEVDKYSTEPGYESLPDNKFLTETNTDPGYEVVTQSSKLHSFKKTANIQRTSSDYDPNYEVLRPTNSDKLSLDDGYAKVLEKNPNPKIRSGDLVDGYSSIKSVNQLDNVDGYSFVKEIVETKLKNHDYASIKETKLDKNLNNNNSNLNISNINCDEDETSDIYSSIPSAQIPAYLNIQDPSSSSSEHHNYSTIMETQNSNSSLVDSLTPTNLTATNSPGYSSISETRTTPSTGSNSSEMLGYLCINNKSLNPSNQNHSSNYGSLTESESDPNYESVKYFVAKENPYERLHNEKSPEPQAVNIISSNDTQIEDQAEDKNLLSSSTTNKTTSDNIEVGDYFQV